MQQILLPAVIKSQFPAIARRSIDTLQVNMGYKCNQTCRHCHVNASPRRKELLDAQTAELVLQVIQHANISCLDLTGGAPEMNPFFCDLVRGARKLGCEVIDRCNLTILEEANFAFMADFLAQQQVTIIASLPCYSASNVDKQRGNGVFAASIAALQKLNNLGYGRGQLQLNLVYNPQGAVLPPQQQQLQLSYKQELQHHFGIVFDNLYTITNMPIARFAHQLLTSGDYQHYMNLLKDNFNAASLDKLMCKNTVSVRYDGAIFDCDFNQMLALKLGAAAKTSHLQDLLHLDLTGAPIAVGEHCYGCTAGQGSSCSGALSA